MKEYFKTCIRWPMGCLIFLLAACNNSKPYNDLVITREDSLATEAKIKRAFDTISIIRPKIQTGDLVTRTGNDFTSESLRSLNQRNQTYSHCGIASIENDTLFVYHALGGEWNPDQKIRRDPLYFFADPYNNRGLGVFRFTVADSIKINMQKVVKDLYIKGIMFDMDFDLKTNERMYCAEFVYKSIEWASHNRLIFPHSHIKDFEFIGVDDIFMHPLCIPREQIVYK